MTFASHKLIAADFDPLPSVNHQPGTRILVGEQDNLPSDGSADGSADVIGYATGPGLGGLEWLGMTQESLRVAGFEGKPGQALALPHLAGPAVVLVGCGAVEDLNEAALRDTAATFARASSRFRNASFVPPAELDLAPEALGKAVVEGVLLARYRYTELKSAPDVVPLETLRLVVPEADVPGATQGAEAGRLAARSTNIARDLANTPPGHLTAVAFADLTRSMAGTYGFGAETFDKDQLIAMGCGGLLGVNAGSTEEPRMIMLRYVPPGPPVQHLALVGKGIMYDSGGISLKPSDPMHFSMKMDMAGSAAIVGMMTALRDSGCPIPVTAFLMCTDNMPSGSAMKLGDVLTIRGGTTVEIKNSDAEGRLVMSDALVLATEESPRAIIDIATLTGAALMALGTRTAALFGNDQALLDRVAEAGRRTDEGVWQLPLEHRYRPQLDSHVADLSNMGGKYAGATTAALFLHEFVGGVPWAHIDMAGTMQSEDDDAWRSRGATGFGARLLLDVVMALDPGAGSPA